MQRFEHARDRPRGDARGLGALEPGRASLRREERRENRHELLPVDDARGVRREPRIRREVNSVEHLSTEGLELTVCPDGEEEAAVRGLERPIRLDRRMRVAVARGLPAGHEGRARDVDERRETGRDEIRPHVRARSVALSRLKPRENRRRGGPAGEDVDQRDTHLVRRPVRRPRDPHVPRGALREEVEPRIARFRTGVARPRDRANDEARVQGAKRVDREAAPLERSREKVLDEDVRLRRPAPDEFLSFRRPEVDGGRLLAAIHGQEVRGFAVQRGRLPAARKIASARVLDLDHASPEIRENHRRERAREDP